MLTDRPPSSDPREAPLDARWRERVARAQERALPPGAATVSCAAPFGAGGLGRHLRELVDASARCGSAVRCVCEEAQGAVAGPPAGALAPRRSRAWSMLAAGARFSPAWRLWAHSVAFDRRAARALPAGEHLIAFNGAALAQLRAARSGGYASLGVVSATAHARRLLRQQQLACAQFPLERPWASRVVARNLSEYALADHIYVSSDYIRESFLAEGVESESLISFPLAPDPRYAPDGERDGLRDTFEIVYVGGLTVDKGVPLLVEAVRRIARADLRLTLVGGWKSSGMRRFLEETCARDARVSVRLGDPLARLRSAALYVHPAYSDGFGYAPAEALACGVRVIASEDTGMKELIRDERAGLVVPTGNLDVLTEAIAACFEQGDGVRALAGRAR